MIEDIIENELRSNNELLSLLYRHEKLGEEIDKLDQEATKNYKSNLRLYIISILSTILTVSLYVGFQIDVLCPLITGCAIYASNRKLNNEYEEDADELNKMIERYNGMAKQIKDVAHDICNNMVERLNSWASEAMVLIRERKFDEIIQNYKKYENVVYLFNDDYSFVLTLLISKAEEGAKSIDDLSEEEKMILYFGADESIDSDEPVVELKIEDLIIEDLEDSNDIDDSNDLEKSKTYTKKKPN